MNISLVATQNERYKLPIEFNLYLNYKFDYALNRYFYSNLSKYI